MLHEKNKEIDGMNKEFQRQIQILVEDHRKEVDVSIFVELIYYHRKKDNLDYRSRGKILHLWSRLGLTELWVVIALSENNVSLDSRLLATTATWDEKPQ